MVMKVREARPGSGLFCQAQNHTFEQQGRLVQRGVVSYYATQTLPTAATAVEWLQAMTTLAASDHRQGLLPPGHLPSLQVLGDATAPLPGDPIQKE